MNKKGQFYLVAAIIIVLAVSGIASVKTYAIIKSEPRKIENIGSELKEETMRIVDYGIYSQENLTRILNNFTDSESETKIGIDYKDYKYTETVPDGLQRSLCEDLS